MTPALPFAGMLHAEPTSPGQPGDLRAQGPGWIHQDRLSLAVCGDIVNCQALAAHLGLAANTPLLELLLAGWRRWAQGLPAQLDGVFALALRDGPRLWLYRDVSGLQNLFVQAGPGRIAFAASLPALRALPGVPAGISHPALHEYLRFLDISAPQCILSGAQALIAGEWLHWDAGELQAPRPFATTAQAADAGSARTGDFEYAVDTVDRHLRAAVAQALDGAERPALMLSGGVDSALLAAIAVQLRPGLTAYTVGFDGAQFDEAPTATRIAQHLGLSHRVLRFGHADFLAALPRVARQLEQPMADPATLATVLAFEHAAARQDRVIDGTGADEIVGLLPPRHVRVAVAWGARLPLALRKRLVPWMRRLPALAGQAPLIDFEHPAETMMRWNGFRRAEIEALCGEPVSFENTQFFRTFAAFPRAAHFERYSALMNVLPCERLNQAARISGLSLRYPFWNPAVVGHMRQLRTDFRYLPGQPKRILRALLARYVPRAIWDAPKHGFDFPLHAFLAADEHALVHHHLGRPRWQTLGLLSPDVVADIGRRYVGGDKSLMFRVWALVMLSAWLTPEPAQPGTIALS